MVGFAGKKMKACSLKASELNERHTNVSRLDRTGSMIDFVVKPSCLIHDEIGRCVYDKENTQLFFDLIGRRYSRKNSNCMILSATCSLIPGRTSLQKTNRRSVCWIASLTMCLSSLFKGTVTVVRISKILKCRPEISGLRFFALPSFLPILVITFPLDHYSDSPSCSFYLGGLAAFQVQNMH